MLCSRAGYVRIHKISRDTLILLAPIGARTCIIDNVSFKKLASQWDWSFAEGITSSYYRNALVYTINKMYEIEMGSALTWNLALSMSLKFRREVFLHLVQKGNYMSRLSRGPYTQPSVLNTLDSQ